MDILHCRMRDLHMLISEGKSVWSERSDLSVYERQEYAGKGADAKTKQKM
jgi:hypothetical protein